MTIGEIKGFLNAISKRQAGEKASYIADTAVASQGEGKSIKKAIETYTKIRATKKQPLNDITITEEDILEVPDDFIPFYEE